MARKTKAPVKEHEKTINILSYLTDKHKEDICILQTQDQRDDLIRDRENGLADLLRDKVSPIAKKFNEIFSDCTVELGCDQDIKRIVLAVGLGSSPRKVGFFFQISELNNKINKIDTTQQTLLDTDLIVYPLGNYSQNSKRVKVFKNFTDSNVADVITYMIDSLRDKGAQFRKDINLSCNAEKFIEEI